MKPVSEWTEEEKNHFLTLLMGECWHEWEEHKDVGLRKSGWYQCKCGAEHRSPLIPPDLPYPNHFTDSGFAPIKSFMEKELPEVWEKYVSHYMITYNTFPDDLPSDIEETIFTRMLNKTLDLTNLITFLLDNQEGWAWIECEAKIVCNMPQSPEIQPLHQFCHMDKEACAGKVKHPAIIYSESLKEGAK